MLSRLSLTFAAIALAISTAACTSLTRPDEILIAPEPPPVPKAPAVPAAAPAAAPGAQAPAAPPGGGG